MLHFRRLYIYREWMWLSGVSSNPVKGRTNLTAQKSNSNTVWFNFQTCIYIYNIILTLFGLISKRIFNI